MDMRGSLYEQHVRATY